VQVRSTTRQLVHAMLLRSHAPCTFVLSTLHREYPELLQRVKVASKDRLKHEIHQLKVASSKMRQSAVQTGADVPAEANFNVDAAAGRRNSMPVSTGICRRVGNRRNSMTVSISKDKASHQDQNEAQKSPFPVPSDTSTGRPSTSSVEVVKESTSESMLRRVSSPTSQVMGGAKTVSMLKRAGTLPKLESTDRASSSCQALVDQQVHVKIHLICTCLPVSLLFVCRQLSSENFKIWNVTQ
jgi:hypothetical protein